jgi:hypothetical protein
VSAPGTSRSIYSVTVSRIEPRPRAAMYLVAVGSLLVLAEAILLIELGLLIVGFFLFVIAMLIYAEPHHHRANGAIAIVLALLSLFFGFGGFYLGSILALAGGVAAIVWSPPRMWIQSVVARTGTASRS